MKLFHRDCGEITGFWTKVYGGRGEIVCEKDLLQAAVKDLKLGEWDTENEEPKALTGEFHCDECGAEWTLDDDALLPPEWTTEKPNDEE